MHKNTLLTGAAFALATLGVATAAQAAVVGFDGSPSTTFADGTFSTNLSGDYPDGFWTLDAVTAYNGYGQNGESIFFNAPVTFNSLTIAKCAVCADTSPTSFTVSALDAGVVVASSIVTPSFTPELLTFNTSNVDQIEFTFTGGDDHYNDGRTTAWYQVSDVTYNGGGAVPEPATWAMMLVGMGAVGFAMRRRAAVAVAYA